MKVIGYVYCILGVLSAIVTVVMVSHNQRILVPVQTIITAFCFIRGLKIL
jgi:hypothetical protein